MNNAELIAALRYCADYGSYKNGCAKCPINADGMVCGTHEDAVAKAADALEAAEQRIADLETALAACRARKGEQLPKEGEWIPNSPFTGNCSECGGDGNLKDKYCSNCGSRMRKGEQE